ncbi:type II toxin-antitoxin system RelE/ParE family toxin [Novosphingobium sp.]|uniref:type II toxin-antitoxin system RelE/ParE family toxin n=1 Tax=Novosphingobium sp. TaxID=1874826 RepID=UPI00286CE5A1|nr:type II toxin-antitoxin system RelE/ParE family toxin [Novosphingobium sp.]
MPFETPIDWIGTAKKDLLSFPEDVIKAMGFALGLAQLGGKHPHAKPWKGEGGGVFEVVENHDGDTYRAVYTLRFADVIYVLHAFQKKSTKGIETAKTDVAMIKAQLKLAQADHAERTKLK